MGCVFTIDELNTSSGSSQNVASRQNCHFRLEQGACDQQHEDPGEHRTGQHQRPSDFESLPEEIECNGYHVGIERLTRVKIQNGHLAVQNQYRVHEVRPFIRVDPSHFQKPQTEDETDQKYHEQDHDSLAF